MKDPKKLFDESVESLDAPTLSKLNQGRHAALAELHGRRALWHRWAPLAGVTAAVIVGLMLAIPQSSLEVPASDMDILLGEESIEMLEDLEFYAWIDTQADDIG